MGMIGVPEWTERDGKKGLDPLGMQNTSVNLYQALLPGISNVTLRIRYYGLYAWLASVYARRVSSTDRAAWQRFVRRAEALYALVVQHNGYQPGVAGINWAAKKYGEDGDRITFCENADPGGNGPAYLRQAWGAYGAAYASQLYAVGIFSKAKEHDIPVPSEQIGDALAEAFEDSLGDAAPRFLEAIERGAISRDDMHEFACMLPAAIELSSRERHIYEAILFARVEQTGPEGVARRHTLQLLLELARQMNRHPSIADVRWSLYSGYVSDNQALSIPKELDTCRRGWWAYQLNDLSHVCFSVLFQFMLERLEQYPGGLPLEMLIDRALASLREEILEWPSTWAEHLDRTPQVDNAWSSQPFSEKVLEDAIMLPFYQGSPYTAEVAWNALQLLGVLHGRVRRQQEDVEICLGTFDSTIFRSVLSETRFLDGCLNIPFEETLARLFDERIIRRHLWIALRKFRYQGEYTYLLELDEGRVRQRNPTGPAPTNPRLGPALGFLEDIGLLDGSGLTARGARCIEGLV